MSGWGDTHRVTQPGYRQRGGGYYLRDGCATVDRRRQRGDGVASGPPVIRCRLSSRPSTSITVLPPLDRRLGVRVLDVDGNPVAARVRCTSDDGRYLAPVGHQDEVNPGLGEDAGADLILNGAVYAYVPSAFEVYVPAEGACLELVRGFEHAPVQVAVNEAALGLPLEVRFGPPVRPTGGDWKAGDTHVHFLTSGSALLQANAEGVNFVHLLATQWGDRTTGLADWRAETTDSSGEHIVWSGSENRHGLLGHVGLVGTSEPILPFASGGPPEGRIGAATREMLTTWVRRARERGGLAIAAHFPLPMAEIAVLVAGGEVDAAELQVLDPDLSSPVIREWYRYLNLGYHLPIVGGTDKMSAGVPLGQTRTWAQLEPGDTPFLRWSAAIRRGRTQVSCGPVIDLEVEGLSLGDTVEVGAGGTVEVKATSRAAQPFLTALELILNGAVIASVESAGGLERLELHRKIRVYRSGWLAARCRSRTVISSAFPSSMAAHTSPIYVAVPGRPIAAASIEVPMTLAEGVRTWLRELACIADPEDLTEYLRLLDQQEAKLRRGPSRLS